MAKKGSKLLSALDNHKGRNYQLEHQKKLQKQAEKRKRAKREAHAGTDEDLEQISKGPVEKLETEGEQRNGESAHEQEQGTQPNGEVGVEVAEQWETDEEEDEVNEYDLSRLDDSLSSSEEEFGADEDEKSDADSGVLLNGDEDGVPNGHTNGIEEDIPLSDIDSLASEERGDIVPHQRLTINNTAALLKAHKSMALPISTLPFSEHQSLTVPEPVSIPDIDDDLNRELAFYAQSLAAANKARALLAKEGVPFTRPTDYFAEMVKSDEHMGRVKDKLVDAAASRRAAAEARRQRDLKKFGKQVQVAKAQERAKEKRDTLDKINLLKRKRKGQDPTNAAEDDLFDVALDVAAVTTRQDRPSGRRPSGSTGTNPNTKRQKKDQKYGFGGKKRHAKSGDAVSSADMRSYPGKRMKEGTRPEKTGASKRLGKARRAKRAM